MQATRLTMKIHSICRGGLYPRSQIKRFEISDDRVPWTVPYCEYDPPVYNSPSIERKPWADKVIGSSDFNPKWHSLDGLVDRRSFEGNYTIEGGFPLNPSGRTGIKGRGVLGRWGPNHAGDPVVTRWKRDNNGDIVNNAASLKPILQLVVVQRKDNGMWALPGGMVDPGENVSTTVIREFMEEATNSLQLTDDEKHQMDIKLKDFFAKGEEVCSTYVDDPRNTDNAWMETTVFSFHDEQGDVIGKVNLVAGDDAASVKWMDIHREMKLYATHRDFVEKVAYVKHCHW